MALPPSSSQSHKHGHIDQKPDIFIGERRGTGRHMTLGNAVLACMSRGDTSLFPKALRGSQVPELGPEPLPSSGIQPLVIPGTVAVPAKP